MKNRSAQGCQNADLDLSQTISNVFWAERVFIDEDRINSINSSPHGIRIPIRINGVQEYGVSHRGSPDPVPGEHDLAQEQHL